MNDASDRPAGGELDTDWIAGITQRVLAATPARIFTGRAGTSYRTSSELQLRADHAAARDAVLSELDLSAGGVARLTGGRGATVVTTRAVDRAEFIRRPDLGRRLDDAGVAALSLLRRDTDMQLVLGDGLSARALSEQAPLLLPLLFAGAANRGWTTGDLIVVRSCRVGILNDIGEALNPRVVILLIGERPGLATATSLSVYLAHRPRHGHTDGERNVVSNIHDRGLTTEAAVARVLGLADAVVAAGASGVAIKDLDAGQALTS